MNTAKKRNEGIAAWRRAPAFRCRETSRSRPAASLIVVALLTASCRGSTHETAQPAFAITEDADQILITSSTLEAAIRKQGYVSGVYRQSLLDKKSGFRDAGFGLDIADFILEPGSDAAERDQLDKRLVYDYDNLVHGNIAKRHIEGPQICTQAKQLSPTVIQGDGFVAVKMSFEYYLAAPGRNSGSLWEQTIVFPAGKRYFISSQKISSKNAADEMFLRIDMPGHIRHERGDTFSEVYLSYHGRIPSSEFFEDFPPDAKFHYRRGRDQTPQRFIRAYHLRNSETGSDGPWLAGMTLDPAIVYEGWCHQRGYISMIEEFGPGRVEEGDSFSAAFIVGYFDSIEEMEQVYDEYAGARGLEANAATWQLTD
ncbi:MAG: hypothetical protein O2968_11700 [Acidobacteria bacterium]|nr:hypothetical protein [Acidobacteriota bacterium]